MKNIATIISLLLFTCSIYAQSPASFNYQGVARDLSGSPLLNKELGFQIAILKNTSTGTEVFKERHTASTNDLGLFNLQIGKGTIINGDLTEIDWGSADYYLQVELDEAGGSNYELIGSNLLNSVPYALYAENGSPWLKTDNGIIYKDKIIIGEDTSLFPNYDIAVNRSDVEVAGMQIINSNSAGRSLFLAGEGNLGRYIYMGYLGENHQSVNSGVRAESGLIFTGGNNGMTLMSQKGPLRIVTGGLTSSDVNMVVTTNGQVGIGNSSPIAKLQIADGDVYIENINRGVIMKSTNGQCWRYTPDNSGQLIGTATACPN